MQKYYLAIDIGASGGRHILGTIENGTLKLKEIYRFDNAMVPFDDGLCWDTNRIFQNILSGMKVCKDMGIFPVSVSIDTWGVDFVLLDKNDQMIGKAIGYRDERTKGMDQIVHKIISPKDLYARTGIPNYPYNTSYQLLALKEKIPDQLKLAASFLMTPDYYLFLLTGKKTHEYTMASTTQLFDLVAGKWDFDLIRMLGLPEKIFGEIRLPGTVLGRLQPDIVATIGYDCDVVLCASHDTASAVMAVPSQEKHALFISSGTWSIVGIESDTPFFSNAALLAGFTNEGGYKAGFYFVKNIMGLWMLQSVKKESDARTGDDISYQMLGDLAEKEAICSVVDCMDDAFFAPKSMTEAIQSACRQTGQQFPETLSELTCVIYHSLASCYADAIRKIESLSKKHVDAIYIIGGGSKARLLNQLTADYTKKPVFAGPTEATAIGNILAQMIHDRIFSNHADARACVAASFDVTRFDK